MKREMTKFYPKRADMLVWDMAGIAHKLLRMPDELHTLYPELVPFLEIVAQTYPALQDSIYGKEKPQRYQERSY